MKKIALLVVVAALFVGGCGSATVSVKNVTGHDQVECTITAQSVQSGKSLDNGTETTITMLQTQDIVITAKKTETGWNIDASKMFHISSGILWTEKSYVILVYPSGELVLQER